MFCLLEILATLGPFVFASSFWIEHRRKGWDWITSDGRKMYSDALNTLVTASGIAVAVVVSRLDSKNAAVIVTSKWAVVFLIVSVVSSIVVVFALSRVFEMAESRYIDEGRKMGGDTRRGQGQLKALELLSVLVPGFIAFACFLEGFLFLGRIAFLL